MRETPKAAAAFAEYCAMDSQERSLAKLQKSWIGSDGKSSVNLRQLEEWSRLHNWQQRVMQYDLERSEQKRAKHDREIEKMRERHAQIGVTQQIKAIEQINELIKAKAFGSMAVVQLLKLATDLERTARGEPTIKIEHTGTIEFATEWGGGMLEEDDEEAA